MIDLAGSGLAARCLVGRCPNRVRNLVRKSERSHVESRSARGPGQCSGRVDIHYFLGSKDSNFQEHAFFGVVQPFCVVTKSETKANHSSKDTHSNIKIPTKSREHVREWKLFKDHIPAPKCRTLGSGHICCHPCISRSHACLRTVSAWSPRRLTKRLPAAPHYV